MISKLLDQLKIDFLVPIDQDEADGCATVGELEHLVYTRVTQYRMDQSNIEELRLKLLDRINHTAELNLSEPLTPTDYNTDLATLASERMTDNWEQTYLEIGLSINRHGIRIETPRWASRLCGLAFFALFIAAIVLWYFGGAAVGLASLVGSFVLASLVSRWVPYRTVKDTATLREAIDQYIEEIEERVRDVAFLDVQVRLRSIFAALKNVDQASVDGRTLL